MVSNLIFLAYLTSVKPLEAPSKNRLNIINEFTILLIAYLVACVNDLKYEPETNLQIGKIIVTLLICSWSCNLLIVLYALFRDIYTFCKRKYYKRKIKNRQKQIEKNILQKLK